QSLRVTPEALSTSVHVWTTKEPSQYHPEPPNDAPGTMPTLPRAPIPTVPATMSIACTRYVTRVRLGFLTRLETGSDAADSYRIALDLFTAAEELGFDTGWVAQHHFLNGAGRLPSVFPFLAAAAQRTK